MQEAVQEEAQCLICQECLLSQVPCALRCGHVYHTTCCQQWFETGKGECPQCKQKSGRYDMLLLEFEVAEIEPRSFEEVRRLRAASLDERRQLREALACEMEEMETRIQQAAQQMEICREAAQEHKSARRELEQLGPEVEAELVKLRNERDTVMLNNASLGAQVDNQNNRQRQSRNRPGTWSQDSIKEDDPASKEELRKLRNTRPADRAKQLHEAVLSARQQEAEVKRASLQREASSKGLEDELTRLKRLEGKLRSQLQDLQEIVDQAELRSECPAKKTRQAPAPPAGAAPDAADAQLTASPGASLGKQAPAPAVAREARKEERPADPQASEEEDLLYGGPPLRRSGASVLRASAAARVARGNKLLGAVAVASLATHNRKPSALQSLFSKRKA